MVLKMWPMDPWMGVCEVKTVLVKVLFVSSTVLPFAPDRPVQWLPGRISDAEVRPALRASTGCCSCPRNPYGLSSALHGHLPCRPAVGTRFHKRTCTRAVMAAYSQPQIRNNPDPPVQRKADKCVYLHCEHCSAVRTTVFQPRRGISEALR